MEKITEHKITLSWAFEGKFNAVIINGVIDEVNFCEIGAGNDECGKCLTSTDFKHLMNVYTALGELFKAVEDQQKELGYKYSLEPSDEKQKDE